MLRLIQKFSVMYVFYLAMYALLMFPLLNYDRISGPDTENPIYIFYQGVFLIWVVLGALWAHEKMEHKTHADRFLRTLPLGGLKIMGAKFTLVFVTTILFIVYQSGMIRILTGNAQLAAATWQYLCVLGSLCLILAGMAYMGIYRFGFVVFGKLLLGIWILLFLSPILLRVFILPPLGLTVDDVVGIVSGLNWVVISLAGAALFWAMLPLVSRLNSYGKA
ncbi:MAG: hypothetical protein ACERK6_00585 [Candidatus Aminicenantaceae bacterium]